MPLLYQPRSPPTPDPLITWISSAIGKEDSAVLGRDSVRKINMLFSGFSYKEISYLHGNALLTKDWI